MGANSSRGNEELPPMGHSYGNHCGLCYACRNDKPR